MLTWRRVLFDTFDSYIFNELPTHLLHVNSMQLVTREDIRKAFSPKMEKVTEADFKEHVASWGIPDRGHRVEGEIQSMIRRHIKFAILSHRWGKKEPSFRDISNTRGWRLKMFAEARTEKLLKFCEKARKEYGCEYAWSDTCCIDRTSSAELEEAIRSMFRWYRNAEVCIVHLAQSSTLKDFKNEEWFTRGWTLQELLAPRRLKFYAKNWQPLCDGDNDKETGEVQDAITDVTSIPQKEIQSFKPGCGRVFEKMVWAAGRKTTKAEDIAYSLVGIFDISMPVAYGEGKWAFHKLMEIIAQRSADRGFFAWAGSPSPYSLALPDSPSCYGSSLWDLREELSWDMPFTLTKEGLQVELLVVEVTIASWSDGVLSTTGVHQLEMMPVTFSPKWSSRRGTAKETISTSTTARELSICRTLAVGIVYGYTKSDDGQTGILCRGREYFCLLLGQLMNNSKWIKLQTKEALTFHCRDTVEGPLMEVCLQHRCLHYY